MRLLSKSLFKLLHLLVVVGSPRSYGDHDVKTHIRFCFAKHIRFSSLETGLSRLTRWREARAA